MLTHTIIKEYLLTAKETTIKLSLVSQRQSKLNQEKLISTTIEDLPSERRKNLTKPSKTTKTQ